MSCPDCDDNDCPCHSQPNTPAERRELVHAIGVWTIRGILAVGAVIAGCMGKDDAAGYCATAFVLSFLFLDAS